MIVALSAGRRASSERASIVPVERLVTVTVTPAVFKARKSSAWPFGANPDPEAWIRPALSITTEPLVMLVLMRIASCPTVLTVAPSMFVKIRLRAVAAPDESKARPVPSCWIRPPLVMTTEPEAHVTAAVPPEGMLSAAPLATLPDWPSSRVCGVVTVPLVMSKSAASAGADNEKIANALSAMAEHAPPRRDVRNTGTPTVRSNSRTVMGGALCSHDVEYKLADAILQRPGFVARTPARRPPVQVGAPVARRLANMRENPPDAK